MKKLVLFFAVVLWTAFATNVFAQSTGENPAPGATHNYSITPADGANTIAWTVWKGDLSTPAGTDATIDAASAASTDIEWATGVTVGDWYYVQVTETDGDGCSNTKVLPVQIVESPFYLTLAAANENQCYDGAVSASIDLGDPSVINYDHGNATIVFTVTPTGLSDSYTGYTFSLADLNVPVGFNAVATYSANASESSGTVTVTDNNLVTITYAVDNTNVYTNASLSNAQDFTATATISNGEAINGVTDNGTDGQYTDDTAVARPNTSGISTN